MKIFVIYIPGYLPQEIEADEMRIEYGKTCLYKGRFDLICVVPDDVSVIEKQTDCENKPLNNSHETN